MEIYKSDIKNKLIKELEKRLQLSEKNISKLEENDENIDRIVDLLCNVSLNEILEFDEKRTFAVRKKLGIFDGNENSTYNDIAKIIGVSTSRARDYVMSFYRVMWKKIINEYKDPIDLKSLTQEELIDTEIIRVTDLPDYLTKNLWRHNIKTIGDLILHTEEQIQKMPRLGNKSLDLIKEFLHSYNLKLNGETEEKSNDDYVRNPNELPISIPSEKDISFDNSLSDRKEILSKYKSLILEKERLQQRIQQLDYEINDLEETIICEKGVLDGKSK